LDKTLWEYALDTEYPAAGHRRIAGGQADHPNPAGPGAEPVGAGSFEDIGGKSTSIQAMRYSICTRPGSEASILWLAQLRKADWLYLLKFMEMKVATKTKKQAMAEAVLQHFEFTTCDGRGVVWQLWTDMRKNHRTLVIQFATQSQTGRAPEFVD
jgi:hypothetical protein